MLDDQFTQDCHVGQIAGRDPPLDVGATLEVALELPPWSGQLELFLSITVASDLVPSVHGPGVFVHQIPIPNQPSLVGNPVEWQALTWDAAFTPLAFTNRLATTVAD